MSTTTIKVPVQLRDRLAEHARQENTTLAGAIAHSLDVADEAAFWNEVRATMGTDQAQDELDRNVEGFVGSVSDGLDPDEDWSDVL